MNNLMRLGFTLDGRMKKTSGAAIPMTTELGKIETNMSLKTDSLNTPIPKGSYMVDIRLTGSSYNTSSTTLSQGTHNHSLPDNIRGLKAGDRVLVAWCGNEPVVIAIVVGS